MENDSNQPTQPSAHEPHFAPPQRSPHAPRHQTGGRKKRFIIIGAVAVVVLLLAAATAWFFLLREEKAAGPAQSTAQNQPAAEEADLPAASESDSTPVAFKSTKLNLELTHRKDWTLKEAANGELTVTSPRISYTRVDGTAGTGVFTLKVRKGATEAMKTTIEKSVAVRDSEVIAYAAPTEAQRHYTNVSWAGQEAAFNFFIVTGSTEIKDGKPFAYMLAIDNETYLIAGGYGSDKDGSLSFDAVPKTAIDSEAKDQAIDIVESIKLY